jgi:hypothetical protein
VEGRFEIRRSLMARFSDLRRLAAIGGLVVAGVIALSAIPSGATIVCPSGIKPPSAYCTNVPPTATTLPATKINGTSAQLNGSAGPNVQGGDITQYFFQYGTTTVYGSQTPTGTIGSCPAGITPPSPYCNVPKAQLVSASVSGLTPCTNYHYRVVASNPDGSFNGADQTFTTTFAKPLTNVKVPAKVKAGKKFKVQFQLKYNGTTVKIFIKKKNGSIVQTNNFGSLRAGKYKKTLLAPTKKGDYKVEVLAKLSCGQQSVTNPMKVH